MEKCKKVYFYLVSFMPNNGETKNLNLGLFSSESKAKQKIRKTEKLVGFSDYSIDDFKIQKTAILCGKNVEKSKIKFLYWLYSEIDYDEYTEWKDFGYYYYKRMALKDLAWLISHTRYGKNNKNSFSIEKIKVNLMTSWSEGFSSVEEI